VARPALSARRAIDVLNLLAAHPGQDFTLSELVEQLSVNIASMHAVLAVLTRSGYVQRDPRRRTYRLGMSPVALGQAALDEHPVMQHARRATVELSDALALECLASVIIGEETLIFAAAGRPERLHMRPRAGQRLPFVPPIGILGAASLGPEVLEAWLDRLGPNATADDREAYRSTAMAARASGYQIELETPARQQLGLLMPELAADPSSEALQSRLGELIAVLGREEHSLTDPQPGASYSVNNMQAPIFDQRGLLIAGLVLLGFDEPLDGERIRSLLDTLTATTKRITRATGGRAPVSL
jgi:DNA-binding IclR family transcriptional regulator